MAITVKELKTLNYLKKQGFLDKSISVIEIGAQQIANNFLVAADTLNETAEIFKRNTQFTTTDINISQCVHGELEHLKADAMQARVFWEWLGFKYAVIDIDNSPNAIPLDLNYDTAPKKLKKKFDLVTNFGTTEHLVNQFNAFQVMHELTKVGGLMMHTLPSQGMMNHGLFNYNPKFFWMLARSNGYKWVFSDYTTSTAYYDLPQNIVDCMLPYNPHIISEKEGYHIADCGLIVALQKIYDSPFVPPLDIPTGINALNATMEKRYWSVFRKNAFQAYGNTGSRARKFARRVKHYVKRKLALHL